MANFNTHIIAGIIVAIVYIFVRLRHDNTFNNIEILFGLLTIPFYSVLPDADQAHSKSRKLLLIFAFMLIIVFAMIGKNGLILLIALTVLFVVILSRHRGNMHSFRIGMVIVVITAYYNIIYSLFALISFVTHLMIDRTTKQNKFPYKK